ncbi:hypothetical protein [Sulfitobacter sp. W074]|uniref:hypothetical protein n=1 Tax=Sulfitobacter sp. W074 TaxID=2867026 RepID=UPI0021A910D4|nr:hypothetical protein [Sulfitobacter sp. W074]UWR39426.1 hypothetical protein K3762_18900 [Sulfitobacter sp. W074]
MGRLHSAKPLSAALLLFPHAGVAEEIRVIAMPILRVELAGEGLNLFASVAGKGGETVLVELTVLREANGSSARTQQSAQVVLMDGTPQNVSTISLGGGPLDSLEARLTVIYEGRLIAETSTIISPAPKNRAAMKRQLSG